MAALNDGWEMEDDDIDFGDDNGNDNDIVDDVSFKHEIRLPKTIDFEHDEVQMQMQMQMQMRLASKTTTTTTVVAEETTATTTTNIIRSDDVVRLDHVVSFDPYADIDDDDDESYVPDSLRDFLQAADAKLEQDLAFLSSPGINTGNESSVSVFVDDDDDEAEPQSKLQAQAQQAFGKHDRELALMEEQERQLEEEMRLMEEQDQRERQQQQERERERERERLRKEQQATERERQIREAREQERLAQEERAQLLKQHRERERERDRQDDSMELDESENEEPREEQQEREHRETELQEALEREELLVQHEEERLLKEQQEREKRKQEMKEAKEREVAAQKERDRLLKEKQEKTQHEREIKEAKEIVIAAQKERDRLLKEQQEKEEREQEMKEAKEREVAAQKERDRLLKEQQEKEEREQEMKEAKEREIAAQKERDRLLKEKQEREQHEQEMKEAKERAIVAQKERDRLLKEKQEREQRERELQEAKERAIAAQKERDRLLKEKQEREQRERELQEARERERKLAAQKEEERRLKEQQEREQHEREMKELREQEILAQLETERLVREQEETERQLQEVREQEREREMRETRERGLSAQKKLEQKQQKILELKKKKELRQKLLEEEQRRKRQEEVEAAERELQRLAATTTTAAAAEEEYDDDSDDEFVHSSSRASLLDIINPLADVTESHLKRIAMEGADCFIEEGSENDEADLLPLVTNTINTPMLPVPSPMMDGTNVGAVANADSMILTNTIIASEDQCPSPPAAKRKLQMELDREANRASLDEKNNQTAEASHSVIEKHQTQAPSQSTSLERRRRMQELEAKRKSTETSQGKKEITNANAKGDNNKFTATARKMEDAMPKLQDEDMKDTTTDAIPSNAAAAAANQAAAVVAANGCDEGPIAIPDVVEPTQETGKKLSSSAGRMGRTAVRTGRKQEEAREQRAQHQAFQPMDRKTRSPPKPTEIITNSAFFQDGRARSVSPLGEERVTRVSPKEMDVVSPLASPKVLRKNRGGTSTFEQKQSHPFAAHNKEDERQNRPTSNRRRQLTRPNHAYDRLSKRTSTSNTAQNASDAQGKAQSNRATKTNPEEEQRKARERIRKRRELQRKKAAATGATSSDVPIISPRGISNNSSSAEKAKKSNARREKMLQLEQERVAKLKAKLKAKEERLQAKKKLGDEKVQHKQELRQRGTSTQQVEGDQNNREKRDEDSKSRRSSRGTSALTVPVGPKFATDHRMGKPPTKEKTKERRSLASSTELFGKGLRSSVRSLPRSSATPEPRQLTIPKAPKLATSQRQKDKSTPFSPPNKKKKDIVTDDMSWSSTLRDVSGISPISKAASSIKTGNLTIPITPHFQPVRKRPLPKSTADKEKEEMQYFNDHPFKAREIKMNVSSTAKKPAPPRKSPTKSEPFHLHSGSSQHRRETLDKEKKEEVKQFKARPMPIFPPKKDSLAGKKSPTSRRPLTTPKTFRFHYTTSHKQSVEKSLEAKTNTDSGTFKALPMPDFKLIKRNEKLKSPPVRPVTSPEPFKLHSASHNRSHEKTNEERKATFFKARPMPDFGPKNSTPLTGIRPKSGKKFTKAEPFNFHTQDQTAGGEQTKSRRKSTRSKEIPTGASGILFRRSIETSNRFSQPKEVPEPKPIESKTFRAKGLPDFIPEVIVTTTPVTDRKLQSRVPFSEGEEKKDSAFYSLPVSAKDKVPSKLHLPSNKNKECDNSTISSYFKPGPTSEEPTLCVREEDPNELRSPDSVKSPVVSAARPEDPPNSQVLHASPSQESLNDPPILVRQSDPNPSTVASPQLNTSMEVANARLRERLSKRRSTAAQKQKDSGKATNSSPKAFRTLQVQSRLESQTERNAKLKERLRKATKQQTAEASSAIYADDTAPTPVKSNNTIPAAIGLPLKTGNAKEKRQLFFSEDTDVGEPGDDTVTPQISNNSRRATMSKGALDKLRRGQDPPKDEPAHSEFDYAQRGTNLVPSMSNEDEASSILQLAQEVQRAAEDELSFYESLDTRNRLDHELGI
eukprot:jgi/Psemu1/27141/gm1.27141_g